MAQVNAIDFNKIPKQKFSKSDVKKVANILNNVQSGDMTQAQAEFDAFARDKKMDKLRSIVLASASVVSIMSIAIAKHKPCPEALKSIGNVIAKKGADFARNHKKVYNAIAEKFPEVVGNVGENFASRALESANVLKKSINKVLSNGLETDKLAAKLSKKGINTFGDLIGIGLAAAATVPTSICAGKIGNILDEYGDGDRVSKKSKVLPFNDASQSETFEADEIA